MRYASLIGKTGLIMALGVALFVGCKKEKEQNGPSLTVAADSGVVTGDQTRAPAPQTHNLRFKLIAQKGNGKDDADLKDYSFTVNIGGTNVPQYANRPVPNGSSFTIDTTVRAEGSNGATNIYTFTVTDKNGKSASRSFKITFQQQQGGGGDAPQIDRFAESDFTNQSDGKGTYLIYDYTSTSGSFSKEARSGAQSNPDKILFLYFCRTGATDQHGNYHSVIAPDILSNSNYNGTAVEWDINWATTTELRIPSGSINFDNVTAEQIQNAFTGGAQVDDGIGDFNRNKRAKLLENRPYIAFRQTRGNKTIFGLIKIGTLTGGNSPSARLAVKVVRPQ